MIMLNEIDSCINTPYWLREELSNEPLLRFEDFPQEQQTKIHFTSSQFEDIFTLIKNGKGAFQDEVITKFNLCPELSIRHFKIIRRHEIEPMTFLHQAVQKGAEKIVDWFLIHYHNLERFCIPKITSSPNPEFGLMSPLHYLISFGENNELSGHIAYKLSTKWRYTTRRNCVYTHPSPQNGFWSSKEIFNQKKMDQHDKKRSDIILTDHVQRNLNGVHPQNNVIFRAARLGKSHILEGLLMAYSEKDTIEAIDLGTNKRLPSSLLSIIYDYSPCRITPLVRNMATLVQAQFTSFNINDVGLLYISPISEACEGLKIAIQNFFFLQLNPETSKIQNYIKTIKLLTQLDNNQEQLPAIRRSNKTYSVNATFTNDFFFIYSNNISNNFLNDLKTENMDVLLQKISNIKDYFYRTYVLAQR